MLFRISLLLLACASWSRATTVVPPTFAELVSEADTIFRGRVTAVEARRVERTDAPGVLIKTFVTFAVERVLKGTAPKELTLEFLGGTVGEDRLIVTGMPKFTTGAREIVFVQNNGGQFCPLVAMMHGRYRVVRDETSARDVVTRDNGVPLGDLSEVKLPMEGLPAPVRAANAASAVARALTSAAFEAGIATEVDRPTLRVNKD